jgi:hypothetical protein
MSAHATHVMHGNSMAAYRAEESELPKRIAAILEYLHEHGPATDREIAYGMGFGENLNAVRPRLTECIRDSILIEVSSRECPVTKKVVRVVGFPPKQKSLFY